MADSLALWTADGNTAITTVDFGLVPAGSSSDYTFRVKNQSGVYTAVAVTVAVKTTGGSEAVDFYLGFADGGPLAATVSLGDLQPSAVSQLVVLRRVTRASASGGAGTCNLVLSPTSWS